MCILALNIIIDKVYLVLWFWFVFVGFLGLIRVICRLFQISSSGIRFCLLNMKMYR